MLGKASIRTQGNHRGAPGTLEKSPEFLVPTPIERKATSIGRVGHDQRSRGRGTARRQGDGLEFDRYPGPLGVRARSPYRSPVAVRTLDPRRDTSHEMLRPLTLENQRLLPGPVVTAPPFEAEGAPRRREPSARPRRSFDRQGTRSAHGIEKRSTRCEARQTQESRSKVLAERRLAPLRSIAADPQSHASEIEKDFEPIPIQPCDDTKVRVVGVDIGPTAGPLPQLIDDRILDLLRQKAGVRHPTFPDRRKDAQSTSVIQPGRPVEPGDASVDGIWIPSRERCPVPQYARSDPTTEASADGMLETATEMDAPPGGPHRGESQFPEFVPQGPFRSAGRGREERSLVRR